MQMLETQLAMIVADNELTSNCLAIYQVPQAEIAQLVANSDA
jgi:hypothetical protein